MIDKSYMTSQRELWKRGHARLTSFCATNALPQPTITLVPYDEWHVNVCAYYRPRLGIMMCLERCAKIPSDHQPQSKSWNWSWPGSVVDRTPFGVICHELGHHVDWHSSSVKGSYFGNYSVDVRQRSREKQVTGYCDNDHEWFAECFRIFVSNHTLLAAIRPKTYAILRERWQPVGCDNWRDELGEMCLVRIIKSLEKKIGEKPKAKKKQPENRALFE